MPVHFSDEMAFYIIIGHQPHKHIHTREYHELMHSVYSASLPAVGWPEDKSGDSKSRNMSHGTGTKGWGDGGRGGGCSMRGGPCKQCSPVQKLTAMTLVYELLEAERAG